MNTPAPIGLFVYKRLSHTQRTVEALQANDMAKDSELIVFCDGARSETDKPAVVDVQEYLRSVRGFARVALVVRDHNLGLANSFISGLDSLMSHYKQAIIMEDDTLTSPYFLRFMNDALTLYEPDHEVSSICGYTYPVHVDLPETYFIRGADTWGVALWQRGWQLFRRDGQSLLRELQAKKLTHEFDYAGAYPFTRMLHDQVAGRNDSWAVRWMAAAFLAGKLTLYPGKSLVQNIGNDGSGVHAGRGTAFDVLLSPSPITVSRLPLKENMQVRHELEKYFWRMRGTSHWNVQRLEHTVRHWLQEKLHV